VKLMSTAAAQSFRCRYVVERGRTIMNHNMKRALYREVVKDLFDCIYNDNDGAVHALRPHMGSKHTGQINLIPKLRALSFGNRRLSV
jgi:hypothetical protein